MTQESEAPPLAGSAGRYREFRPPAALQRQFACLWSHAVPAGPEVTFAVVPDGCVDLLWIDGRLMVAGPDRMAMLTTLAPGSTVLGARFTPGAAAGWLGLPMSEIVDRRVPLDDLAGAWARALAGRIGDAGGPASQLPRLVEGLARIAPGVAPPDPGMALAFAWLGRGGGARVTAALLDRLDISERSFRRRCHDAFGYGPKTLGRIRRFQGFLALARRPDGDGLAALADRAGYADQAHLTRDVRALSGLTPSAILRRYAA